MTTIFIVTKIFSDYEGSYSENLRKMIEVAPVPILVKKNLRAFTTHDAAQEFANFKTFEQSARQKLADFISNVTQKWMADNPRPNPPHQTFPLPKKNLDKKSREDRAKYTKRMEQEKQKVQEWVLATREHHAQMVKYSREQLVGHGANKHVLEDFDKNNGWISREEFSFDVEPIELEE